MPMKLFTIRSRLADYEVFEGGWDSLCETVDATTDFLIVDSFIAEHHVDKFAGLVPENRFITIKALERNKTVSYAMRLVERIMDVGITKKTRIVSMGGGIVQDLTGFIASILYRGLQWHFYPTTLLAQADSCIGAKTSINFKSYKNLIGSFYNPARVVVIPDVLDSLPEIDYLSGLGEIIKLHIIGGGVTTAALASDSDRLLKKDKEALARAVIGSLTIKKGYIEEDEFDKGIRNILNYGHCIGHAIESSTRYAVPHGQAVTWGMLLANRQAEARGYLDSDSRRRVERTLLLPFIQERFQKMNLDADSVIAGMKRDKKRVASDLVVVSLATGGGMIKRDDVKESQIRDLIAEWNVEK